MRYISTRGHIAPMNFVDAALTGLADDGGLILPESIPNATSLMDRWESLSYSELAREIFGLFSDLPQEIESRIIEEAYSVFRSPEVVPVIRKGDLYIMELFHGPTLAFKDIALQFLGRLFEYVLETRNEYLNVLGATSGDTGSAAIYGIKGRKRMSIFIMHPEGRVSPVQERQMTSVMDENVHNIAVAGTFDDCQKIAKDIFCDLDFKTEHRLGSINSINWARLLPQIVYYFYGYFQVRRKTNCGQVSFSVPTGNFGDIFAGYIAAKMGLPVKQLILATNENDILHRFFQSGVYDLGEVKATLSPSMDIQVASNFERYLYYKMGNDPEWVKRSMKKFAETGKLQIDSESGSSVDSTIISGKGSDKRVLATIRDFHERHNYLLDPHTAVGVDVGLQARDESVPLICLATAHPAKFPDAIKAALGEDIARHPVIDSVINKPTRLQNLRADTQVVKDYIASRAGKI